MKHEYFIRKEDEENLGGELSFKIKSVYSDRDFIRPSRYSINTLNNKYEPTNDLSMQLDDGNYFHICGNNDWAFLALDLLKPIKDEAKSIIQCVKERKEKNPDIKAVTLGKNDKRIMDIYFGGKGRCDKIVGLPVITTEQLNEVKFLVEKEIFVPF